MLFEKKLFHLFSIKFSMKVFISYRELLPYLINLFFFYFWLILQSFTFAWNLKLHITQTFLQKKYNLLMLLIDGITYYSCYCLDCYLWTKLEFFFAENK